MGPWQNAHALPRPPHKRAPAPAPAAQAPCPWAPGRWESRCAACGLGTAMGRRYSGDWTWRYRQAARARWWAPAAAASPPCCACSTGESPAQGTAPHWHCPGTAQAQTKLTANHNSASRFYDVDSGEVSIGGTNVRNLQVRLQRSALPLLAPADEAVAIGLAVRPCSPRSLAARGLLASIPRSRTPAQSKQACAGLPVRSCRACVALWGLFPRT